MKLSTRLSKCRIDRPDEWTTDEFARQARHLEDTLASLHPSVIHMAFAMQEKLEAHAEKKGWPSEGGKRGWLKPVTHQFLLGKLREEVIELQRAVMLHKAAGAPLKDIRLEAADVANMAMMIADNLGAYDLEGESV